MLALTSRRLLLQQTFMRCCKSVNSVTLVGVVHDIQSGFVYEDAVTQFTLTTTSIDTTHPTQEVVVEKDHHTIRCFGELFSAEVKQKVKEGNVVCVNGRLRLSPQLEPSCNKHFYFPYIQVQPPHGQVAVIHGDRRTVPAAVNPAVEDIKSEKEGSGGDQSGVPS
ncbi:KREPA6 [Trypanosoma equiperdum]|uniref:MP18 RNA editing complex protein n=4 Tax=Trypanozoon TaxID=39700 RepID=Q38B90_TRYB2|nr:MP18 RNA editing complex protein [Trypanosoma brucei brucei TREU927]3K81_C Chain C, MP18 RNA editing complex protein [Trypanosoma brucei]3K81_D Chain D, MP18 RNA editing complex protein [Trypanosoma brucei]RHW68559.1 KREPA6 [Trypanosoma brucei equiperdum]SCU68613.1 KREPA6 [Trypanosoma equiperdum]EAN77930.1 MP18 RNA editing complex protein [Trypanosoma brucei brucei TREU927]